jgi:hypothetical protein
LSRIEGDGRNWLRRPKLCAKSCRAVIIIIIIRRRIFAEIKLVTLEKRKGGLIGQQ